MTSKASVELIEDLINQIDTSYQIKSVVDLSGGKFRLDVDCTLWLRPCKEIEIDSFTFRIDDFEPDAWIEVSQVGNTHIPITGEQNAPAPFYIFGTIRMVNGQISAIGNSKDFTPLIYFVETYTEEHDEDPDSVIDYEADVSIMFMDDSNFEDWAKATEHYKFAINPMRSLVDAFLKVVRSSGKIGQLTSYRLTHHSNFGVFNNNQGHVRRLLEAELSGVELRITLPVCKDLMCVNKC